MNEMFHTLWLWSQNGIRYCFYTNRDVPRSGCLFLKSSFNTCLPLLLLLLSWSSTMGPPAKARLSSPTYTLQSNQQVQKTGPKDHDISYLLTRRRTSSNNSSLPQQHGHRVPAMEMYRALWPSSSPTVKGATKVQHKSLRVSCMRITITADAGVSDTQKSYLSISLHARSTILSLFFSLCVFTNHWNPHLWCSFTLINHHQHH